MAATRKSHSQQKCLDLSKNGGSLRSHTNISSDIVTRSHLLGTLYRAYIAEGYGIVSMLSPFPTNLRENIPSTAQASSSIRLQHHYLQEVERQEFCRYLGQVLERRERFDGKTIMRCRGQEWISSWRFAEPQTGRADAFELDFSGTVGKQSAAS